MESTVGGFNARVGILAADGVLLELAKREQAVTHRLDYAFGLGGGKCAVAPPRIGGRRRARAGDALRAGLANEPIGEAGHVSVSSGNTELLPQDDRESFAARAEGVARRGEGREARHGRRHGGRRRSPKRNGTLHQLAPGEIVLEG